MRHLQSIIANGKDPMGPWKSSAETLAWRLFWLLLAIGIVCKTFWR